MREERKENQILLRGTVEQEAVFSHEGHGERFYRVPMIVPRLSGVEDHLNVVFPQRLLELLPAEGTQAEIRGEVRSYNNRGGIGNRLIISVYAREILPTEEDAANVLTLTGTLCKQPVLRRTPLGRDICDLMLAVGRGYGRADYLPCIAWGVVALRCGVLGVGDTIDISGRLQSREYTKIDGVTAIRRTAFEVSVMELEEPI
ncbi:MAG: single-stranded DNA-binding protein [Oscillospiraceae bacterium]|nr:single-stranded DNA-binding protein [Oscillospiraceae bacterium]